MAKKLFTEFPPVPTEKWEEVIIKDLKGADYEKKLVWRTQEGFNVRPYYRAENLEGLKHLGAEPGEFPYVRGTKKNNEWFINQWVCCCRSQYAEANAKAVEILAKGVESITFYLEREKVVTKADFAVLLKDIDLTKVPVNFGDCCIKTAESVKNFIDYVDGLGIDKDSVKAFFDFNPLKNLTNKGYFCEESAFKTLAGIVRSAEGYKGIRVIEVDANAFNNAGSSTVQELAFALSEGSEYLARLTEEGISAETVAAKIAFTFGVGSTYFMEIAKFRAARMLWANIVDAYGVAEGCARKMNIHAVTSEWNQTVYDSYVNMLRATTEAMSAAIAGVDYLEVTPFDYAFEAPTDFSNRIARNVQSILKKESHFNKVVDPAAGSYYVENLTASIAEQAWNTFKAVEDAGGYVSQFKAGAIQSQIKAVSDKKDANLAARKMTLLGTNQFPNFLEKAEDKITKEIVSRDIITEMGMVCESKQCCEKLAEPLLPYRGAEAFEALRLATDRSGKEPKAFMLTFGNLAMCRARAQFSSNFFAVAGIRNIDNNRFETIEEGVKAALDSKAEIVVACSSDEEYAEAVPQIAKLLGDKAILVVAGDPECRPALEEQGIKNYVNVRCNVLETLKGYQKMLGIKEI
ncbi:MAG: methylmalonyl-CoA mutase small subunit [Bacteroidales bacterium]|nr:methylmalonyl-CoA mutase small subunit [Candidatus Cacconaster merdequi]